MNSYKLSKLSLLSAALLGFTLGVNAQSVPHTFAANTPARAVEVNANFQAIVNAMQTLRAEIEVMETLLAAVSAGTDAGGHPSLFFDGVNVQVRAGSGQDSGLGNVVIGYYAPAANVVCDIAGLTDEASCEGAGGTWAANQRQGTHSLIIGDWHNHTARGALISGFSNSATDYSTSIIGGQGHLAAGSNSVLVGGALSITRGSNGAIYAGAGQQTQGVQNVIGGGLNNTTRVSYSTVGGGSDNTATGNYSHISGGQSNTTDANYAAIGGGFENLADGVYARINGGRANTIESTITAEAQHASISGGYDNHADGRYSTVSGGYRNEAQGNYTSISGGANNEAAGEYGHIEGGNNNGVAPDAFAGVVSGGSSRGVHDNYDWRAGELSQTN